jgi:uroporphyrin-III C-methyltransferase/precorrin-2 dehydrogenase/sirohydrochlorin ferrochelatase
MPRTTTLPAAGLPAITGWLRAAIGQMTRRPGRSPAGTRAARRDRGRGSIALVGAGPGAADLMTLRALDRLRRADVIFYDRLVDLAVLDLGNPEARRVYVGKDVGNHHWPQAEISRAIVEAALSGQRVVRLKSGDPGIFGRAAEETAAAAAAGIPVEIVPGITAASAATAQLGLSLTERGLTDHVTFATGHCRAGAAAPDWAGMFRPGAALAIYMGVGAAGAISASLMAAGAPPDLPVDVVSDAETPRARHVACTLATLPRTVAGKGAGQGIDRPSILLLRWPKDICATSPASLATRCAAAPPADVRSQTAALCRAPFPA